MVAGRRYSIDALVVFLGLLAGGVAADSCVTFTSTVDGAGDPGPGSQSCLPYTVEVSAVAGTAALAEASALSCGLNTIHASTQSANISLNLTRAQQHHIKYTSRP